MTILQCATYQPLDFERDLAVMPAPPRCAFLHTNGGGPDIGPFFEQLYRAGSEAGEGIGSTFQVYSDGRGLAQLVDTRRVIYAQYDASHWSTSFETQDDGNPDTPWTDGQLTLLETALRELADREVLPLRLMRAAGDSGIGYHEQFPAYNQTAHRCPGPVREHQILTELIPALQQPAPTPAPEEDPMLILTTDDGPGGSFLAGASAKPAHIPDQDLPRLLAAGVKQAKVSHALIVELTA